MGAGSPPRAPSDNGEVLGIGMDAGSGIWGSPAGVPAPPSGLAVGRRLGAGRPPSPGINGTVLDKGEEPLTGG